MEALPPSGMGKGCAGRVMHMHTAVASGANLREPLKAHMVAKAGGARCTKVIGGVALLGCSAWVKNEHARTIMHGAHTVRVRVRPTDMNTHTCTRTHTSVQQIHTHARAHTHTHTHTHTHRPLSPWVATC